MTDRMAEFLNLVRLSSWKRVPQCWGAELREALNIGLVKIGFGGVLKITPFGQTSLDVYNSRW